MQSNIATYQQQIHVQAAPPTSVIKVDTHDRHTPPNNNNITCSSLSSISPNSSSSSASSSRNSPDIPHHTIPQPQLSQPHLRHQSTPSTWQHYAGSNYYNYSATVAPPQQQNTYNNYYEYYQLPSASTVFSSSTNSSRNSSSSSSSFINESTSSPSSLLQLTQMNDKSIQPTAPTKPLLSFSIERILAPSTKPVSTATPSIPVAPQHQQFIVNQALRFANLKNNEQVIPKKRVYRRNAETASTQNSSSSSNKRIRTIFTQEQLDQLEVEFNRQQYMVGNERSYLAEKLGLSESQVKIWFQNRRIKWRKSQQNSTGRRRSATVDGEDETSDDEYHSDVDEDNHVNKSQTHTNPQPTQSDDNDDANDSYSYNDSACDD